MMTDQEINNAIDEIQKDMCNLSAEARNALHACRPNHPLGEGKDKTSLFRNAAFVIGARMGSYLHSHRLNKIANAYVTVGI